MKSRHYLLQFAVATAFALPSLHVNAETYEFQFKANPDALDAMQDKGLDVTHTITLDSGKIHQFNSETLARTDTWLSGGIRMTMTHQGKTALLNDGLNPGSVYVSIPGANRSEGFIDLSSPSIWFFALEFAPGNSFIDSRALPYDPFVYGFLFVYQNDKAFQDFRDLWIGGDTSVLPQYQISPVPEPGSGSMAAMGLLVGLGLLRTRCKEGRLRLSDQRRKSIEQV